MPILHQTRTLPALLPRYVERFSCIGPECEDNCCTGWTVTLDKKTFNAYRQSKHPALSERFAKNLSRQRSQGSDLNYARIDMKDGTQECPMMEDRLCGVQKNLDESHLSHTCFTYPRTSRNFGGQFEQGLTLSCPEAARKALLAPDAFDFIEGTITVRSDLVAKVVAHHGIPLDLMNELRIFCLQLMRTEGLELWQRLAVLGVFCESLSSDIAAGKHAGLGELLHSFTTMVEQGLVHEALADLPPNHVSQALVFSVLWRQKKADSVSPQQNKVFKAIADGLGANPETGKVTPEQLVDAYSRGVARLPAALEAAPHLLENYILNEMFCNLFPFDSTGPYDSYRQLVSRFGVLRLMLAAQCTGDTLPDAATMVHTVQAYCRRFQHDTKFAKQVNQILEHTGWATLDKLYGFLRS